ncbi:MAG TPA: N-acetyltransferase [Acidobacteriaceae bacterium]|nr:N-acetyltransferase [Acidobacteriaceae bacterium]
MLVRDAKPEDFADLYALDQACFVPGISWSRAELGYFLRYPGNISLVAEDERGKIAGFAVAGTRRRGGSPQGRLITIDIHPELRRRRIGHTLLLALEERLLAVGVASMRLEVAIDNLAAIQFYAQHGFERSGRIPGYYLGRIDALVMEKPL